jgi:hypothetical protein
MNRVKTTQKERDLYNEVLAMYDETCNLCFTRELTNEEKGIMGSLVKKGLVHNSTDKEVGLIGNNYFPTKI